jgi:hypothetical protein
MSVIYVKSMWVYNSKPYNGGSMQQVDLFGETLEKKILRLEKWTLRLQKEMWFLKEVYHMSKQNEKFDTFKKHIEQTDLFGT